ncbi:hypothetical protein V491_00372 [Pseudogymnoascus sp. VKM F-3775]|nr:hypothetical protein V491_00372 [Pseudogymnoascus sp. VKM F-3775]
MAPHPDPQPRRTVTILLSIALSVLINIFADSFDCYFGLIRPGFYWRVLGPNMLIRTFAYNVARKATAQLEPPIPSPERYIILSLLPAILAVVYVATSTVGPFREGRFVVTIWS